MKQIYVLGCTGDKVIHFRLDEANGVLDSSTEFSRDDEDASTTLFKLEVTDDLLVGAREDTDEVRVLPSRGSSSSEGRYLVSVAFQTRVNPRGCYLSLRFPC